MLQSSGADLCALYCFIMRHCQWNSLFERRRKRENFFPLKECLESWTLLLLTTCRNMCLPKGRGAFLAAHKPPNITIVALIFYSMGWQQMQKSRVQSWWLANVLVWVSCCLTKQRWLWSRVGPWAASHCVSRPGWEARQHNETAASAHFWNSACRAC